MAGVALFVSQPGRIFSDTGFMIFTNHKPGEFFFARTRFAILGIALLAMIFPASAQSNAVETLCAQTKQYCDEMHATKSAVDQKILAAKALDCATRVVAADTNNATAHLCLAVAYVKNFQFVDTRTAINYSRGIKAEAETAIRLDPKNDVSYYLLGRWHYGVANMNFIYKGLVKLIYGGLPRASNELAKENFLKAIALAPNRIIHHLELAKTYHVIREKNLALEEINKCAALSPTDRDDADAKQWAADILRTGDWP
jgi:tetratricopeptide (TPR) repeat protein